MSGVTMLVAAALLLPAPVAVAPGGAEVADNDHGTPLGGVSLLVELRPGTLRHEVEGDLARRGVDAIALDARTLLIEATVLETVFERQQLYLRFDGVGRLVAAHLRVEPDGRGTGAEIMRIYADVRAALTRALGRPAWERAEGVALPGESIYGFSEGTLVRYLQWEGGAIVRAGIPRRVDGAVYVEVIVTGRGLPRSEVFWGLDGFD